MRGRWLKRLVPAAGLVFLILLFAPDLLRVPAVLLTGWVSALGRLWPSQWPGFGSMATVLLACGLLVWGSHRFCGWVYGHLRENQSVGSGAVLAWAWRWTGALYLGLAAVLLSGMAVVGVAHQVVWMVVFREPMFVPRFWAKPVEQELLHVADSLLAAAIRQDWNLRGTRAAFQAENPRLRKPDTPWWEDYQIVWVEGADRKLARALVLPRNPRVLAGVGMAVVDPTGGVAVSGAESASALSSLWVGRPRASATPSLEDRP